MEYKVQATLLVIKRESAPRMNSKIVYHNNELHGII